MNFKSEIFKICAQIASENDGWSFLASGIFKYKTLKHSDLVISPGFYFHGFPANCSVGPWLMIYNKKISKLYKHFFDHDRWVSGINFRTELADYYRPPCVRHIWADKNSFSDARGVPRPWPDNWILLPQADAYLRKLFADGLKILSAHYDLTSEQNLLRHLPTSYKWMDKGMGNSGEPGSFYEEHDGIMLCLAAIILGDFEFVERYASDDFKTMLPKRDELHEIMAALPAWKRKFEETGSAV